LNINSILKFAQARHRRSLDQVREFATFIGPGSVFTGNFQGRDNYVVLGRVRGNCDLDGALVLGEGGSWEGHITATNVVIAGEVTGNVTAREKLELAPSARIRGDMTGPVIAIAEGAMYDGQVVMGRQTRLTRFNERRSTKLGDD
jgi:cytoskeletal protein CcmA (bactofilin family)